MDTNNISSGHFDCKRFLEKIIRICTHKNAPVTVVEHLEKRCICAGCIDPLSRAHSESARQFRQHDRELVHKWLTESAYNDSGNPQIYVAREVQLEGFAEAYLEKLEEGWCQAEKR
ncbi:MAG: hypothetical protein EKK48_10210 [Candidatus Melainabacteria bacterium]|nr:MAG: hypothetical protein EKK48_10210 [Candidatus Melainabacteria bacterium]